MHGMFVLYYSFCHLYVVYAMELIFLRKKALPDCLNYINSIYNLKERRLKKEKIKILYKIVDNNIKE